MSKIYFHSEYTNDISHIKNYLVYAGEKLEAQELRMNDGSILSVDPDELLDLKGLDVSEIKITTKSGREVLFTPEEYIRLVRQDEILEHTTPKGYIDYIAEREGVVKDNIGGLFTINGSISTEEALQMADKHEDKTWWINIISLNREDAERVGLNNRESFENLIRSQIPNICKNYNISLENLVIYGAYHHKINNPHVHLFFTSKDSREGFVHDMKQSGFAMKSDYYNTVYKDDVAILNKEKEIHRKELSESLEKSIRNLSNKNYMPNQEILNDFTELSSLLKTENGKLVYGYLSKASKERVNELLFKIVSQDKEVSKHFEKCLDTQQKFLQNYTDKEDKIKDKLDAYKQKLLYPTKKDSPVLQNIIIKNIALFNQTNFPELENIIETEKEKHYSKNEKSFFDLEVEAESGSVNALYQIGKKYHYGSSTLEKDIGMAMIYYEKSARLGHPYANYVLGSLYAEGKEVEKNIPLATEYFGEAQTIMKEKLENSNGKNAFLNFKLAEIQHYFNSLATEDIKAFALPADLLNDDETPRSLKNYTDEVLYLKTAEIQGETQATSRLEELAFNDDVLHHLTMSENEYSDLALSTLMDIQDKFEYLEKSADSNNSQAQYALGQYYLSLEEPDVKKAIPYLEASAKQNNPYAQYALGSLYSRGELIAQDEEKAVEYFSQAFREFEKAEQKSPNDNTEYRLGTMLLNGVGTEKDIPKAIEYLEKSAEQDNSYAQYELGKYYLSLPSWETKKGIAYLESSTQLGNESAKLFLAKYYIQHNNPKGIQYLNELKSSQDDFTRTSAYRIQSNLYLKNNQLPQAEKELLKVFESDFVTANDKYTLGLIYDKQGHERIASHRYKEAFHSFQADDDSYSNYMLGIMYLSGRGCEKDTDMAKMYFEKSSRQGNEGAMQMITEINKKSIYATSLMLCSMTQELFSVSDNTQSFNHIKNGRRKKGGKQFKTRHITLAQQSAMQKTQNNSQEYSFDNSY